MQSFRFTLTGQMPLLMHRDDVEQADNLSEWRKAPENKDKRKAGDDRSPAWTWQTYLYHDGEYVCMPSANIMTCLRGGGARVTLSGAKTYKEMTQSGLLIEEEFCEFRCGGNVISVGEIQKLRERPFAEQSAGVRKLGFQLFVKRAPIGQAKHIRVRPRFNEWSVHGVVQVLNDDITDVLPQIFQLAGKQGLGDWRPSAKKSPGPFGMFGAKLERV